MTFLTVCLSLTGFGNHFWYQTPMVAADRFERSPKHVTLARGEAVTLARGVGVLVVYILSGSSVMKHKICCLRRDSNLRRCAHEARTLPLDHSADYVLKMSLTCRLGN